jgi:low affinity Fe/Cu permease
MKDHKPVVAMVIGAAVAIVVALSVLLAPNGIRDTFASKKVVGTSGSTPTR